ncbi:MAG TPA: hypothetical protein VF352_07815 [Anaerolineales bacterium]
MTSYRQETLAERGKRMAPGVMYGAIASTVYVLVSSIINVIFFPGLHLGVDWISLLTHWIEFSLALALAGGIVGWFTEDYMGIVGGGVVLTILLLVGNMIASLMGQRKRCPDGAIVHHRSTAGRGRRPAGVGDQGGNQPSFAHPTTRDT